MTRIPERTNILTTKVRVDSKYKLAFANWQAKLNALIAAFPGFVSLEILSPQEPSLEWIIVQRFYNVEKASEWQTSKEKQELMGELKMLLSDDGKAIQEVNWTELNMQGGVTEVFVTEIVPGKDSAYREWIAKIHQIEAQFPGFKGVYVQAPTKEGPGRNWITLLQFDTPENLDSWLSSVEREEILRESRSLIASLDTHRVISPYAGWFASVYTAGEPPPVWKQTAMVLLVLFPIIMLEFKFLSPWTSKLNPSIATFIGNAISVSLVSWPLMPIAIWFFGWWLSPKSPTSQLTTLRGALILMGVYLLEIAIFWNLL